MRQRADVRPRLLTIGHGTASQQALLSALHEAQVEALVDVRRFPRSAAHPHVDEQALAGWLPPAGVSYRWEPRLGGRRRLPRGTLSPDTWWTVEAFRAYAGHTRSEEFRQALGLLLDQASTERVAVMCSETVWWRCHRRLIADVAVLACGVDVGHLLPPAAVRPHRLSAGARLDSDGSLVWDGTGG